MSKNVVVPDDIKYYYIAKEKQAPWLFNWCNVKNERRKYTKDYVNWYRQFVAGSPIPTKDLVQRLDKGFTSFDLALKKDFNEGRVSSTFQFTNIFATQRRETFINTPDLYSYRLATPRWPFISISFTFRLNNFNNLDKIQTEKGSEF